MESAITCLVPQATSSFPSFAVRTASDGKSGGSLGTSWTTCGVLKLNQNPACVWSQVRSDERFCCWSMPPRICSYCSLKWCAICHFTENACGSNYWNSVWYELQNIIWDLGPKNCIRSNLLVSKINKNFPGEAHPQTSLYTTCGCTLGPLHLEITCYGPALQSSRFTLM